MLDEALEFQARSQTAGFDAHPGKPVIIADLCSFADDGGDCESAWPPVQTDIECDNRSVSLEACEVRHANRKRVRSEVSRSSAEFDSYARSCNSICTERPAPSARRSRSSVKAEVSSVYVLVGSG